MHKTYTYEFVSTVAEIAASIIQANAVVDRHVSPQQIALEAKEQAEAIFDALKTKTFISETHDS